MDRRSDATFLDRGDRATAEHPRRYQPNRPGELVHVDVKKLSGIPDGGGWRIYGRGQARSHGSLGWASSVDTLTRCSEDDLPAEHN